MAELQLFILDTFEWRDADGMLLDRKDVEIGGGGTYAAIGARMWLLPHEVGMLVDRGTDWDGLKVQGRLDAFGEMWHWRDAQRPTTRALNLYTGEHRDFEYLNARTRLEPRDLPPSLRSASWLHFVCSPTRALDIVAQLDVDSSPQNLCFEPIPDRCCPEEMDSLLKVLPRLAVFSPNHEEAWAFFGVRDAGKVALRGKQGIEEVARRFVELGASRYVVIRSGAMGAYTIERGRESEAFWTRAFHAAAQPEKVVDVTGGGNTFLGGLMAGLVQHAGDVRTAVAMASVSASFIIEQFGLARLERDGQGHERWNGVEPSARLREMLE